MTDCREEVNEAIGKVYSIVDQFGCFVVPGEDVMVIVPSLTKANDTEDCGVCGTDIPRKIERRRKEKEEF